MAFACGQKSTLRTIAGGGETSGSFNSSSYAGGFLSTFAFDRKDALFAAVCFYTKSSNYGSACKIVKFDFATRITTDMTRGCVGIIPVDGPGTTTCLGPISAVASDPNSPSLFVSTTYKVFKLDTITGINIYIYIFVHLSLYIYLWPFYFIIKTNA